MLRDFALFLFFLWPVVQMFFFRESGVKSQFYMLNRKGLRGSQLYAYGTRGGLSCTMWCVFWVARGGMWE